MTNKEIVEDLKDYLINLMNCTDNQEMKNRLHFLHSGSLIDYCKCEKCGSKFAPKDGFKSSFVILSSDNLQNKILDTIKK